MEKENVDTMTLKDKVNYFQYSHYSWNKFTLDEYIKMMDEEFLAEVVKDPMALRLNSFFGQTGINPTDIYKKFLESGDSKRSVDFLKVLASLGNPSCEVILREAPKQVKDEVLKHCLSSINDVLNSSRKNYLGTTVVDFAYSLDNETFARLMEITSKSGLIDDKFIKLFVSNSLNNQSKPEMNEENMIIFLNVKGVKDVVIRDMDAADFYYFASKYHFSGKEMQERKDQKIDILRNAKKMTLATVKDALAEVFFETNARNASLDLKSLVEYAKSNPEYAAHLEGMTQYFQKLIDMFSMTEEPADYDKWITKTVGEFMEVAEDLSREGINLKELLTKETELVKGAFGDSIEESIRQTVEGKINTSSATEVEVAGKKVKTIKIDLKKGEKFYILGHSQSVQGETPEEIEASYYKRRCQRSTVCCSLFDESHLSSFIDRQVLFGYYDFQGAELLSSTTQDGQTGQRIIAKRKDRKVYRQEYLSLDDFMEQTGRYNELAFGVNGREKHGVLRPNVIICTKPEPSKQDYLAAAAFGVPIVIIDKSMYEQKSADTKLQNEEYSYPVFSEPTPRQPSMQSQYS